MLPIAVAAVAVVLILRADRGAPGVLPERSSARAPSERPADRLPSARARVADASKRSADAIRDRRTLPRAADPEFPEDSEPVLEALSIEGMISVLVVDPEGDPIRGLETRLLAQVTVPESPGDPIDLPTGRVPELPVSRRETNDQGIAVLEGRPEYLQFGFAGRPDTAARQRADVSRIEGPFGDPSVGFTGDYVVTVAIPMPDVPRVAVTLPHPPAEIVRIELSREALRWLEPMRVRVVDADGEPAAGVGVRLRASRANDPSECEVITRESTREDGVAFLPRRAIVRRLESTGTAADTQIFELGIDHAFADAPRYVLDSLPGPDEIELRLPPTATVVLQVADATGELVTDDVTLHVAGRPSGTALPFTGERRAPAISGRAVFEHVGLYLDLRVRAEYDDGRAPRREVEIAGPSRPGERLESTVRFESPWPWVTARVRLSDGTLIAGRDVSITLPVVHARPPSLFLKPKPEEAPYSVRTDGSGRFRTVVRGRVEPPNGRALVIERGNQFARVDLSHTLRTDTEVDLGEIRLQPVPVLIGGRVVDEAGTPVGGAKIRVSHLARGPWMAKEEDLAIGEHVSGADGRFWIRWKEPPERVTLHVSDRDVRFAEVENVIPGSEEIEVVVREPDPSKGLETGVVAGRVVLDDSISFDHLHAALLHPDGRPKRSFDGIAPDGTFRNDAAPAGRWRFRLRTARSRFTVIDIHPIEVVGGDTLELDTLDLRGTLRYVQLRVVTPDGFPAASADVRVYAAGSRAGGGTVKTDERGRLAALVPNYVDRLRLSMGDLEAEVPVSLELVEVTLDRP